MISSDLAEIDRIAAVVHPDHPEDAAVFRERLQLYPAGCFVLDGASGVQGYILSHPWRLRRPPALNTLLGRLPATPDTLYLHDLAVLPTTRAGGRGTSAVDLIADQAQRERLSTLSLLAVGRSLGFWQRNGFRDVDLGIDLSSYGTATFMTRAVPQKPNM
jgi:hypothetical protein